MEYDREDGLAGGGDLARGTREDVYFNGQNAWVYTEWDIHRSELPEAVTAAIPAEYASYTIDDIEYVQTPDAEYYLVELECGKQEIELRITAEGPGALNVARR